MDIKNIFTNRKNIESLSKGISDKLDGNTFWDDDVEASYNLYYDRYNKQLLSIPKTIIRTIVDSASQEFDFSVEGNNNFDTVVGYLKSNIRVIESNLLLGGSVALKPYIKGDKLGVAVYDRRDHRAYFDEFGILEKVVFKSDIRKSEFISYTLVETHEYNSETREYRIENQLYKSSTSDIDRKVGNKILSIGTRVELESIPETSQLDEYIVLEGVDRHLCSVITLDNSMTYNKGEPILKGVTGLIVNLEKQYDSLLWEYRGGELALDVSADLMRPVGKSKGKSVMPEGKERLYRQYDGANPEFGIQVFNPNLRDENYIRGLNLIKRQIESAIGLYYGALSDIQETQKTAAEVISSKQRFYILVLSIKNKLRVGINDILENCAIIYNHMMPDFLSGQIQVKFEIGDSVIDIMDT